MKKIWTYFKNTVLVWGFVSLGFLAYAATSIWIQNSSSNRAAGEAQAQETSEPVLDQAFGDLQLKVTRKSDTTGGLLVSVSKANEPLVTDYNLPTAENGLDWVGITNAKVIPVAGHGYRIVLYSGDGDESGGQIWLLKWDGQMRLVKLIQLASRQQLDDKGLLLFGNATIVLPQSSGFPYESIAMPLQVSIGEVVRIAPMLNQQGLDTFRAYFDQKIAERTAKLTEPADAALLAQYKKAKLEFSELVSAQVLPY